ncbi:MAG: hypothetical protein HC849_29690 [Oscillatoriales cyanobacterium RU_3_3]|nr:hypothetical protein [Oscillatoriales cyanobacterium RU_3_3]
MTQINADKFHQLRAGTGALPPLRFAPTNCQLSTVSYQLSTILKSHVRTTDMFANYSQL